MKRIKLNFVIFRQYIFSDYVISSFGKKENSYVISLILREYKFGSALVSIAQGNKKSFSGTHALIQDTSMIRN